MLILLTLYVKHFPPVERFRIALFFCHIPCPDILILTAPACFSGEYRISPVLQEVTGVSSY